MRKIVWFLSVLGLLLVLFFTACESPEFTSAKLYVQQNNLDKAEEFFIKAMEKEPMNSQIPFMLGYHVYYERQQWDKMNEAFDKSLAIDNRFAKQIEAVRMKASSEYLQKGAKIFNMAISETDTTARNALVRKALEEFKLALTINPHSVQILSALVKSYRLIGDDANFEKYLDQALKIDPQNEELMVFKAEKMMDDGKFDEARVYLEDVIKKDASNRRAYLLLAETFLRENKYDEAMGIQKRLLKQFPNDPDVLYNIGMLYLEELHNFDEAEFYFQKLLTIKPDDVEVIARLAEAYTKVEKWAMAEEYYRKLLEFMPDNKAVWQNLYICVYRQGRLEEALELKKKADSLP